jgi:hypothetical protein
MRAFEFITAKPAEADPAEVSGHTAKKKTTINLRDLNFLKRKRNAERKDAIEKQGVLSVMYGQNSDLGEDAIEQKRADRQHVKDTALDAARDSMEAKLDLEDEAIAAVKAKR